MDSCLVEMLYKTSTMGVSHLTNLGSPFLNSSNARDCSWNTAKIDSGDLHSSKTEAIGCFLMSCPVRLVYLTNATSIRVSKLEGVEVIFEADDMALRKMLECEVVVGGW